MTNCRSEKIRLSLMTLSILLSVFLPAAVDGQSSHEEESASCGSEQDTPICRLIAEIGNLKRVVDELVQRNQGQETTTERIVRSLETLDGRMQVQGQSLNNISYRLDQSLDDVRSQLEAQDQYLRRNVSSRLDQISDEVNNHFDESFDNLNRRLEVQGQSLINVTRSLDQSLGDVGSHLEDQDESLNNLAQRLQQLGDNITQVQFSDDISRQLESHHQSLNDVARRLEDQTRFADNATIRLDQSLGEVARHLDQSLNNITHHLDKSLIGAVRYLDQSLSNVTCNLKDRDQTSYNVINNDQSHLELLEGIYNSLYLPSDCNDIYARNNRLSRVYGVYPSSYGRAVDVFCDMKTSGGPWLIFQRRKNGSVSFDRNWRNYTDGFGDPNGDFWLGNENLHLLTSNGRYKLRIELEDFEGEKRYAEYSSFSVSSGSDYYRLRVSGYSGNAGDSFASQHNGQQFTTKDADHDSHRSGNCAIFYRGGWWFNACHASYLNGLYLRGNYTPERSDSPNGIVWLNWRGHLYSMKTTEMKISRVD